MANDDSGPIIDSRAPVGSSSSAEGRSITPQKTPRQRKRIAPETEALSEKRQRRIYRNPQIQPRMQYFTPGQLDCMQAQEAQAHQFEVDNGLCWRQIYPAELLPPTTNIYANGLEELFPTIMWTGEQKSQFFELIGRRGKNRLPEISLLVGKSVVECQRYLCLLETQSNELGCLIDRADIPASEEVPTEYVERDLPVVDVDFKNQREIMAEQQINALRAKSSSYKELLFSPKMLYKLSALPPDPQMLKSMDVVLHEVLRRWLRKIIEFTPSKRIVRLGGNKFRALLVQFASQFVGFDPDMLSYVYDEEEALEEQEKKELTRAKKIATRKATMAKKRAKEGGNSSMDIDDENNEIHDAAQQSEEANKEEEITKKELAEEESLVERSEEEIVHEQEDLVEEERQDEDLFDDYLLAEWEDEQANQNFDSTSSDENEDLMQLVDDIPDESELCEEETEWLELFDTFQSEVLLQMRGLEQELQVDPPPPRSERLIHFMCT